MSEHIILARLVSAETDILVLEKAITFLLKGEEAGELFEREDYVTLRQDAISGVQSKRSVLFNTYKISVHPSKDTTVKECIVALSFIKPVLASRCSQPMSASFQHRQVERSEGDVCH